jgi:hypothetical protein
MTHAFFVVMGGFVYGDEQSKLHAITTECLFNTDREYTLTTPQYINHDSVIPAYNNVPGAPLRPGLRSNVVEGTEKLPIIDLIALVREEDIVDKSEGDGLSKLVAMVQVTWFIAQCISRLVLRLSVTELYSLDARVDLPEPRNASEDPEGVPSDVMDLEDFAVSLWKSLVGVSETRSDKVGLLWAGRNTWQNCRSVEFSFFMGSVFGAIHCAAWRNIFPTNAEKWLWQSSYIVIACVPILLLAIIASTHVSFIQQTFLGVASIWMFSILLVLYSICRLLLLVLPLIQLRSLPPDVSFNISWSSFIPHI